MRYYRCLLSTTSPIIHFFLLLRTPVAEEDPRTTSIVGGVEVEPKDRYPYQVAMIDDVGEQYCGGTLVDKDWVLCAGHCMGVGSRVHIGRHDLSDNEETYESIEIEWEIPHPKFNSFSLDNDIMMVKLKQSSSVIPVKLDRGLSRVNAGTTVIVIGWGDTSYQGTSSNVLLEAEVEILSDSECAQFYEELTKITDNMVCAARLGKDSCQGDSGGPLIVKGIDGSEDVQVAIVSWGRGCGNPEYPGVYALVGANIGWIDRQIASGTSPYWLCKMLQRLFRNRKMIWDFRNWVARAFGRHFVML